MPHDFDERLRWGERCSHEPFWEAVYRKAFPNLVNHMAGPGDTESQRQGIDRVLLLASGQLLRVDEKKREESYPDILLEYLSVDKTGAPGWIECDKHIDYLAYAFMRTRKVYLLPWAILLRAWRENRERWKEFAHNREFGFRLIEARNRTYSTWSVAVPIDRLYTAMNRASIIIVDLDEIHAFDPFNEYEAEE